MPEVLLMDSQNLHNIVVFLPKFTQVKFIHEENIFIHFDWVLFSVVICSGLYKYQKAKKRDEEAKNRHDGESRRRRGN